MQRPINTLSDQAPFVIDWANGNQSSILVPQRAQEMLSATSGYLQQAHDSSPVSFNFPLFSQYVATFTNSPTPLSGPSSHVAQESPQAATIYPHTDSHISSIDFTPYTYVVSSSEKISVAYDTDATLPEFAEWNTHVPDALSHNSTTTATTELYGHATLAFSQ